MQNLALPPINQMTIHITYIVANIVTIWTAFHFSMSNLHKGFIMTQSYYWRKLEKQIMTVAKNGSTGDFSVS